MDAHADDDSISTAETSNIHTKQIFFYAHGFNDWQLLLISTIFTQ